MNLKDFMCFCRNSRLLSNGMSHDDVMQIYNKHKYDADPTKPALTARSFRNVFLSICQHTGKTQSQLMSDHDEFRDGMGDRAKIPLMVETLYSSPSVFKIVHEYKEALQQMYCQYAFRESPNVPRTLEQFDDEGREGSTVRVEMGARAFVRMCRSLGFIPEMMVEDEVVETIRLMFLTDVNVDTTFFEQRKIALDSAEVAERYANAIENRTLNSFLNQPSFGPNHAAPPVLASAFVNPFGPPANPLPGEPIMTFPIFVELIISAALLAPPSVFDDVLQAQQTRLAHALGVIMRLPKDSERAASWTPLDALAVADPTSHLTPPLLGAGDAGTERALQPVPPDANPNDAVPLRDANRARRVVNLRSALGALGPRDGDQAARAVERSLLGGETRLSLLASDRDAQATFEAADLVTRHSPHARWEATVAQGGVASLSSPGTRLVPGTGIATSRTVEDDEEEVDERALAAEWVHSLCAELAELPPAVRGADELTAPPKNRLHHHVPEEAARLAAGKKKPKLVDPRTIEDPVKAAAMKKKMQEDARKAAENADVDTVTMRAEWMNKAPEAPPTVAAAVQQCMAEQAIWMKSKKKKNKKSDVVLQSYLEFWRRHAARSVEIHKEENAKRVAAQARQSREQLLLEIDNGRALSRLKRLATRDASGASLLRPPTLIAAPLAAPVVDDEACTALIASADVLKKAGAAGAARRLLVDARERWFALAVRGRITGDGRRVQRWTEELEALEGAAAAAKQAVDKRASGVPAAEEAAPVTASRFGAPATEPSNTRRKATPAELAERAACLDASFLKTAAEVLGVDVSSVPAAADFLFPAVAHASNVPGSPVFPSDDLQHLLDLDLHMPDVPEPGTQGPSVAEALALENVTLGAALQAAGVGDKRVRARELELLAERRALADAAETLAEARLEVELWPELRERMAADAAAAHAGVEEAQLELARERAEAERERERLQQEADAEAGGKKGKHAAKDAPGTAPRTPRATAPPSPAAHLRYDAFTTEEGLALREAQQREGERFLILNSHTLSQLRESELREAFGLKGTEAQGGAATPEKKQRRAAEFATKVSATIATVVAAAETAFKKRSLLRPLFLASGARQAPPAFQPPRGLRSGDLTTGFLSFALPPSVNLYFLTEIADTFFVEGDLPSAFHTLSFAVQAAELLPASHPDKAVPWEAIGACAFHCALFRWAARCFFSALRLREQSCGCETALAGTLHVNLGLCLFALGRQREARAFGELGVELLKATVGVDHPWTEAGRVVHEAIQQEVAEPVINTPHLFAVNVPDYGYGAKIPKPKPKPK